MAGPAHLDVYDVAGDRTVPIEPVPFAIGRRDANHLRLGGAEISRDHAHITLEGTRYILRDRRSRYGTFVNGVQVTEHPLQAGDRIRLGRGGGAELVFGVADGTLTLQTRSLSTPALDIREMATLLEGLRALGHGRVLHEVLALVLDSAISVSGADRGFIMLVGPDGTLQFRLARANDKTTIGDATFKMSRKFPEEAFRHGRTVIIPDLQRADLAADHAETVEFGIRQVLCLPLHISRFEDAVSENTGAEERRIGVLYLDSRDRGALLSETVRGGLETLAAEAAVAIENARLYREAAEKLRMDREMRIAADIQSLLLPKAAIERAFVHAAAASLPCRSIGGDFFDYADQEGGRLAFTLGDVAGKGPSAALLGALVQGMFSLEAQGGAVPSSVVSRVNTSLCRRAIESRFATVFYGVLDADGHLAYCNGGQNPPFLIGPSGVRRLEVGGTVVGLMSGADYQDGFVQLEPGDRVVIFSDGVSDAVNNDGEDFGDDRIRALLESTVAGPELDATSLVDTMLAGVRRFANGAAQNDDITVMVVRYRGRGPS